MDTFDRVVALLNHKRAKEAWIFKPTIRYRVSSIVGGKRVDDWSTFATKAEAKRHAETFAPGSRPQVKAEPAIVRLARIVIVDPIDGAGPLRVGVTSWTPGEDAQHHIAAASGYGYGKTTACLVGAVIDGIELGDDCDHKGRPTLQDAIRANGWESFGI